MECSLKKFDGTVSNKRSRGQRDLPPFSSRSAAGKWRKSWIHSTIFETEKAREGFFRVRWQAASLGGGSGRIIAAPHGTEGASAAQEELQGFFRGDLPAGSQVEELGVVPAQEPDARALDHEGAAFPQAQHRHAGVEARELPQAVVAGLSLVFRRQEF